MAISVKSRRVQVDCSKGGLTQQNFKNSCDINSIVDKARSTGFLSSINSKSPVYQDCTHVPDYQSALNTVIQAEHAFNALPSKVRERFSNNPQNMISFLANPVNTAEAVSLGLMAAKPVATASTAVPAASASVNGVQPSPITPTPVKA